MMNNTRSESTGTDSGLLDGVREPRNHAAWEKFIARYEPMIRGWCRHWFPREADDRACEVLSELVFRMINFEYDRSKGRFRGWLKTVTNNLMAKLKKEGLSQPSDYVDPLESVEAREDLAARLARDFDLEQLEKAKDIVRDRVEPHTWAAYWATAEEGQKPADVARQLGVKVGTVHQARHWVKTLLKQEIEKLQGPA
jgi:RNA polymerase sigma-70 factor (ECF subfamily)